jgi:hypothetical protein
MAQQADNSTFTITKTQPFLSTEPFTIEGHIPLHNSLIQNGFPEHSQLFANFG